MSDREVMEQFSRKRYGDKYTDRMTKEITRRTNRDMAFALLVLIAVGLSIYAVITI